MNRHVKFDAASFILGGEIRNRTNNKQTQTNSKRYMVQCLVTVFLSTYTDRQGVYYTHLAYRYMWIKKL